MRTIPGFEAEFAIEGELSESHTTALITRRANALRALEKAEAAENPAAAADARKRVQEAQRLIQRYGLD